MRIEVVDGPDKGEGADVTDQIVTIGRDPSNELVLSDEQASSRHAAIEPRDDGTYVLRDLQSTNGTFKGDTRLRGDADLTPDEPFRIARNTLRLIGGDGRTVIATAPVSVRPAPPAPVHPASSPEPIGGARKPVPEGFLAPQAAAGPASTGGSGGSGLAVGLGIGSVVVLAAILAVVLFVFPGVLKHKGPQKLSEEKVVAVGRQFVVQLRGTEGQGMDFGTGIIFNAKRGLAVTNAHVVSGLSSLTVRFNDGQTSPAQVIGQAPCDDIAVIQISNPPTGGFVQAQFSTTPLQNGQHVTALGYPGSLANLETEPVNSTDGAVAVPDEAADPSPALPDYPSVIQHTATINPGNSGGPLLDDYGHVVGMNTLALTAEGQGDNTRAVQGQYYAITAAKIQSDLSTLQSGQNKAYLGWDITPLADTDLGQLFSQFGLGSNGFGDLVQQILEKRGVDGLIVKGLDPGSIAARDFSGGDLITSIDGTPVTTVSGVCSVLNSHGAGSTIAVNGLSFENGGGGTTVQPLSQMVTLK